MIDPFDRHYQDLREDGTDRQHLRLFIVSHLWGPLIGLLLSGFLLALGFPLDGRLKGFAILVCLFWAYPVALRLRIAYRPLSLLSIQHLTFVILWASHSYGGLASPFLLWLAVVPLLAFLYSAPRVRLWLILVAILAFGTTMFAMLTVFVDKPSPVDPASMQMLAGVSLLSALAYVSMMAGNLGQALSARNKMAKVADQRSATATTLERRSAALRRMRVDRAAGLAQLAQGCRTPVVRIVSNCEEAIGHVPVDRRTIDAPDLLSIKAAAVRLMEHIDEIERYGADLSRDASLPI